jgi:hypothetical protein
MATLFVARSANLSKWASDVGLGKNLFKLGLASDKDAMKARIDEGWAGETDWRLVGAQETEESDEAVVLERIAAKEKLVDPNLYPRIKGAAGLVRVAQANVLNAMLVAQAMATADQPLTAPKSKPKDFADYLIRRALG